MTAEGQRDSGEWGRLAAVGVGLVTVFSLLSGRLWVLQGLRGPALQAQAEKICLAREELPAKRGPIVDRDGVLLAASQTVYTLYADKYHLRDYQIAVSGLAAREGLRASEVRRRYSREELLEEYESYAVAVVAEGLKLDVDALREKLGGSAMGEVILARELEEDARRDLVEFFGRRRVRGVYFRKDARRYYPGGSLLAHVLGYVDGEGKGQEGLEKVLQPALAGVNGFRRTEHDSRGRELVAFRREERRPSGGLRVRLTVDRNLQERLEEVLDRAEGWLQPKSMAAILMDPHGGQILAMASRPGFDPEKREGNPRNMAVALQCEPGSTFKLVTMAAAMDAGLVKLETKIPLADGSKIGEEIAGEWLSPARVMALSSNRGIHAVARSLGAERLYRAMVSFGFGQRTGIWLTGEEAGQVHEPQKWSGTSLNQISMGYEVATTPLQMLMALASVANGGKLLQPRVVQALETPQGEVVFESETEFVQRVMSEEAAAMLLRALSEVALPGGTGEAARVPGFTVAGKTGTAWWYDPVAKKYQEGEVVASFVGVVPAEAPRLAGIVLVECPQVAAEWRTGGRAAAPVFAEIVRMAADRLDLVPSSGKNEREM